jgi:hypothetical protein
MHEGVLNLRPQTYTSVDYGAWLQLRDIARPEEKISNLEVGADGQVNIGTVAMSYEEEEREEARQLEMERRSSARGTPSPGLDQAAAGGWVMWVMNNFSTCDAGQGGRQGRHKLHGTPG